MVPSRLQLRAAMVRFSAIARALWCRVAGSFERARATTWHISGGTLGVVSRMWDWFGYESLEGGGWAAGVEQSSVGEAFPQHDAC